MTEDQMTLLLERAAHDPDCASRLAAAESTEAMMLIAEDCGLALSAVALSSASVTDAELEEFAGGAMACKNNSLATVGVMCTTPVLCK